MTNNKDYQETTAEALIDKAKASKGWVFIEPYGETHVYWNGQFHHRSECTLSASLYHKNIKHLY